MTTPNYRYEFGAFDECLEHFCAPFEIDPPESVYEDGEPTLTDPLMDWITQNNANMNWLFAGSSSAILREWMDTGAKERKFVLSVLGSNLRCRPGS
ncbi:MAG: hypothetical protein AAGA38_11150 [Pseudomonadota bacterium]